MSFIIGFLTFLLILNCVLLALLILVQLPKKEAGLGVAFGGGAADALFGAGSGNVLTKLTKYVAGAFFLLAIALTVLNANVNQGQTDGLREALEQEAAQGQGNIPVMSPATNTQDAAQSQQSGQTPALISTNQAGTSEPAPEAEAEAGDAGSGTNEPKSTNASGSDAQ